MVQYGSGTRLLSDAVPVRNSPGTRIRTSKDISNNNCYSDGSVTMSASSRMFAVLYRPATLASASCIIALSHCNEESEARNSTPTVRVSSMNLLNAQRACCEESNEPISLNKNRVEWKDDSFPNMSRHGSTSMLREFLTKKVFDELKDKKTASGVTLEDLIRAGVCLPYGANPPHGIAGVYAGDAESYTSFRSLLDPIIEKHHMAATRVRLQRFRTNLNPGGLLQRRLDPKGEYILYTRMRLARSIKGFRFAPCIERGERRKVEQLFRECVSDWKEGEYVSVMDMTNKQHDELVRRQLLFSDPDDYIVSAGLARDWPDARGIYCDTWRDTPNLIIWCNSQDHIWIISNAKGGDVQGVFTRMSKAVWALETSLKHRGHGFAEDSRLGFLNTSPADIGTALRASVYIKLVHLGQHKGFQDLMQRLHLEARAEEYSQSNQKRYTGIFDIGNAEALGKTEVQLINIMIHGVAVCIDLERRLENGEKLNLDEVDVGLKA